MLVGNRIDQVGSRTGRARKNAWLVREPLVINRNIKQAGLPRPAGGGDGAPNGRGRAIGASLGVTAMD